MPFLLLEGPNKEPVIARGSAEGFLLTQSEGGEVVGPTTEEFEALAARVAALEAMLAGAGAIVVDTIEARLVIAKTTTLGLVTKTDINGTYDKVVEIVKADPLAITPATKLGFFGETPVAKQTITTGFTVEDLENKVEAYGLVEEVDP